MNTLISSGELMRMFLNADPNTIIRRPNLRRFAHDNDIRYIITNGKWNKSDRLITSYCSAFGYGNRTASDNWFKWYISGAVSSINTPGVQRQLPTLRSFNKKLSYSGKTDYQSGAPSKHPMVGDLEPVPGKAISTIFTNIKSPRHHKAGVNNIFMDGHYQFSKYGTYNNSFSSSSSMARLYWSSN